MTGHVRATAFARGLQTAGRQGHKLSAQNASLHMSLQTSRNHATLAMLHNGRSTLCTFSEQAGNKIHLTTQLASTVQHLAKDDQKRSSKSAKRTKWHHVNIVRHARASQPRHWRCGRLPKRCIEQLPVPDRARKRHMAILRLRAWHCHGRQVRGRNALA